MAIVTISRQLGTTGTRIAEAVATALDLDRLDRANLDERLAAHGITAGTVEHFDEKRPSFWDSFSSDKDKYLHYLTTAILESAEAGNVLILGRGAPVILRDVPGAVHLRCIAPLSRRLESVQNAFSCSESQARKLIHQSDRDRSGFYRYFFDVDWDNPGIYDLTINTAVVSESATIEIVRDTVRAKNVSETESSERISDLLLSQAVTEALLYRERLPVRFLGVRARDGVVTIAGSVNTAGLIHQVERIAASVPGVRSVTNEIQILPEYTGTIM